MKYYQGCNDVVSVFLLTLDSNLAFYCADVFWRFFLIDYLQLGFDQGLIPLFSLCAKLLKAVDEDLYNFITLDGAQPTPMFMTSWFLTLLSHDVLNLEHTRRIYDLVLAEHPLIIVYLCASLIIECHDELMTQAEEFGEAMAPFVVFKSPMVMLSDSETLERVIARAL